MSATSGKRVDVFDVFGCLPDIRQIGAGLDKLDELLCTQQLSVSCRGAGTLAQSCAPDGRPASGFAAGFLQLQLAFVE